MKIGNTIYLDHQASCPLDPQVREYMLTVMRDDVGNPHSGEHSLGWAANQRLEEATSTVAHFLGCDPDEVIFTSGATEANNLAIKGLVREGGSLAVSAIDHKCVIESARTVSARGARLRTIQVDQYGHIDIENLQSILSAGIDLVSVIGVHNEMGAIQDLKQIGRLVREAGAVLHSDLAQAPCAAEVRDNLPNVDCASFSAHKFYGPVGVGCLYVSRALQSKLTPLLHGGGQQAGLRSGTVPIALCAGMAEASRIFDVEGQKIRAHLRDMSARLFAAMNDGHGQIILNGPSLARRHPGNLNVSFVGIESQDLIGALQPHLALSSGSACTSGMPEPSYSLTTMGLPSELVRSAVRLSVGRFTTADDAQRAGAQIASTVAKLQQAR